MTCADRLCEHRHPLLILSIPHSVADLWSIQLYSIGLPGYCTSFFHGIAFQYTVLPCYLLSQTNHDDDDDEKAATNRRRRVLAAARDGCLFSS